LEVGVSEEEWSIWAKISGRRGRPPPIILHVGKTRTINLSYGIRMWAEDYGRMHTFDRETDSDSNSVLQ